MLSCSHLPFLVAMEGFIGEFLPYLSHENLAFFLFPAKYSRKGRNRESFEALHEVIESELRR